MTQQMHWQAQHPQRSYALWFSLCIALFMAMAPTVSRVMVWAQPGSVHEDVICGERGNQVFSAGNVQAESDKPGPDLTKLSQCLYCCLGGATMGPSLDAARVLFLPSGNTQRILDPSDELVGRWLIWAPPLRGRPTSLHLFSGRSHSLKTFRASRGTPQ
jgi:hypothetical protein